MEFCCKNILLLYQLVRDISVIFAGHALSDSRFHQSRERWQYIDGRIDL